MQRPYRGRAARFFEFDYAFDDLCGKSLLEIGLLRVKIVFKAGLQYRFRGLRCKSTVLQLDLKSLATNIIET